MLEYLAYALLALVMVGCLLYATMSPDRRSSKTEAATARTIASRAETRAPTDRPKNDGSPRSTDRAAFIFSASCRAPNVSSSRNSWNAWSNFTTIRVRYQTKRNLLLARAFCWRMNSRRDRWLAIFYACAMAIFAPPRRWGEGPEFANIEAVRLEAIESARADFSARRPVAERRAAFISKLK